MVLDIQETNFLRTRSPLNGYKYFVLTVSSLTCLTSSGMVYFIAQRAHVVVGTSRTTGRVQLLVVPGTLSCTVLGVSHEVVPWYG
jgi:hypothetical protein